VFLINWVVLSTLAFADEHEHRQLGAHEHGVGQLNVALEDASLYIELVSPAMNIVGFEHAPNNPEQEQAVQQAKETLEDGNQVFSLPSEAQCELAATELETDMGGAEDTHSHEAEQEAHHEAEAHAHESEHDEEVHSEFHVNYEFRCANPASLTHMDVQLFSLFPTTEELQVQTITGKGQTSGKLNPASTRLAL
jgi:hypothetical protein